MGRDKLRVYTLLSRLPRPKSYLNKFLVAAFLGTHVPLLALAILLLVRSPIDFSGALLVLAVVLLATIAGAATTLYVLYALLAPVSLASNALRRYLDDHEVPDLPTGFDDRAGRLMADVQYTIGQLDEVIRSLEEQSMKDHLTGAYNRRACEEQLAEDIARVQRSGSTMTLALLDLDQLKQINDQHGHQAGDVCLMRVADTIHRNIRESDWFGRWGGDEFLLVLWDTAGKPSVEATLGRIVEDLGENPVWLTPEEAIRLTLSGGVHQYAGWESPQDIFARADEALYRAKGRTGPSRLHPRPGPHRLRRWGGWPGDHPGGC